jgi:hypothetical protein
MKIIDKEKAAELGYLKKIEVDLKNRYKSKVLYKSAFYLKFFLFKMRKAFLNQNIKSSRT